MYEQYPWGRTEEIEGIGVHVPAAGYVMNRLTGQYEKEGVYKRSPRQKEQYWERPLPPEDWDERRLKEINAGAIDPVLESYRRQEWARRLNGFWFMNKGNPTYITGLHYFYLTHWKIGQTVNGYPDYRDRDRRFFYLWNYIEEDPNSLGLLYVTRRREGKTSKGGCAMFEPASRNRNFNAAVVSKTEDDTVRVVFQGGVVKPYLDLPDFFRPAFDTSGGRRPKKSLTFTQPSARGKAAMDKIDNELRSMIWAAPATTYALDGSRLERGLIDEIFKCKDIDIRERHRVMKYACTDGRGQFAGKLLVTSTVEEFEGAIEDYRKFWEGSNQAKLNENKRTETGLYSMFTPAYEALLYDEYGFEDIEANKTFFLNERASLAKDPVALQSEKRKNPFSIEEAFRVSKTVSAYDINRINDQIEGVASYQDDMLIEGDLVWTDGQDSEVKFVQQVNGPFRLLKNQEGYEPDIPRNGVRKVSGLYVPNNANLNVIGVDPFDHVSTVDSRRSNGAAYLYRKYDSMKPETTGLFVVEYIYRQQHPKTFYEDMIKLVVWSGASLLFEDQKQGIRHYFEERGYLPCMMHLPNRKEPGIPSSFKTKADLVETTKAYILDNCDKIYFLRLLEDLRDFEPLNTKIYDAAMAAGWCLVADKSFSFSRSNRNDEGQKRMDLSSIFGGGKKWK
jgi:hypothetical protein